MPPANLYRPVPQLVVLALTALLFSACDNSGAVDAETTTPLADHRVPVRVAPVLEVSGDELLYFAGIVRNRQRAVVTFQVGGVIEQRVVEIGDSVQQGDELARLFNPQLGPALDSARARLTQLRSDHAQAERDLDRLRRLLAGNAAAEQDVETQQSLVDRLTASIDDAEAAVRQAQGMSEERILRAPFAGTINSIALEPGEFAQPGQAVMQVSSPDVLEAEVRIPGRWLDGLQAGAQVPVLDPMRDLHLQGVVRDIGRSSDGTLYPLVVTFDDGLLRTGDAIEVGLQREPRPALAIPLTAVMRSADGLAIFRVESDTESGTRRVRRMPVEVDRLQGEQVLIRRHPENGLQAGDRVVYAGLTRLTDGDSVLLMNAEDGF